MSRKVSRPVFVDTSYIIALFNPRDGFHDRAVEASSSLTVRAKAAHSVTTEAILTEIGNAFARPPQRDQGIQILQFMREDPALEVITVDHPLFDRAVALYSAREDKDWGLTDCISFVAMQERRITDALTTDHHFEQAGFRIVL